MDYQTTHTSLSPIRCGFTPGFVNYKKGCTRFAAASDKVYQLLAHGRWFSPGTPAPSTTKTGRHDIAESGVKTSKIKSNQIILFHLNHIGGVIVSMITSSAVDCWFKPQLLVHIAYDYLCGVMVSMLASSVIDCGFESRLGQIKDYKIGIWCFSVKHTELR